MYTQWNTTQPHIKRNKILPSATTWMDLEGIMLSEKRQRKINTVCYHLYMESKKKKLMDKYKTKQKQTHRHREQTSIYQWGEGQDWSGILRGTNYSV